MSNSLSRDNNNTRATLVSTGVPDVQEYGIGSRRQFANWIIRSHFNNGAFGVETVAVLRQRISCYYLTFVGCSAFKVPLSDRHSSVSDVVILSGMRPPLIAQRVGRSVGRPVGLSVG